MSPSVLIVEAMDDAYYEQMRETLAQWADVPDEAWLLMKRVFRVTRLPRLGFALKPGDQPSHVFFVCSGLLRYFSGSPTQRPANKVFLSENMFTNPIVE